MMSRLLRCVALAIPLCCAAPASAQDAGAVGVVMAYPSVIGVMWHVSDRIALRPEASFSTTASDNPQVASLVVVGSGAGTTSGFRSTSNTVGVGISGLITVAKWDALRVYLAPRFVFSRTSGRSTETSVRFVPPTISFGP